MKSKLTDFVSFKKKKTGRTVFKYEPGHESNLYKFLYEIGYRKVKGKQIYYQRTEKGFVQKRIFDIRREFLQLLEERELISIPNDLPINNLKFWFFDCNPIRQNGLLKHYLEEEIEVDLILKRK